jgi:hypothetical protein
VSDVRVEIHEKPEAPERCAYCHDALDEGSVRCPACRIGCHPDCRELLSRCPTLGCPGTLPEAEAVSGGPPSERVRELRRSLRRELVALGALILGCLGAAAASVAFEVAPCAIWIPATFVFGAALARFIRIATRLRIVSPLAASPPVAMTLRARNVSQWEGGSSWEADLVARRWLDPIPVVQDIPRRLRLPGERPVHVRGLRSRGRYVLIENESGRLAVVRRRDSWNE